jgi:hypothetical protein
MVLEEAQFGTEILQLEAPDLLVVRVLGEPTDDTLRAMCAYVRQLLQGKSHIFILVDLTTLNKHRLSARQRSILAEEIRRHPVRGTAIVTRSFQIRVIATLVSTLTNILSGRRDERRAFFETEVQARAWLDEERRRLKDAGDSARRAEQ